jgi:hypothetical protein
MVVSARTMLDAYRMEIELTRTSVDEFLSDACNELDLFVYYLDLPEFGHFDVDKAIYVFNMWRRELAAQFLKMRQLH